MAKRHAYHDHFEKVPMFRGLSNDEYDHLAQAATQLDYTAGTVLMREGETAHEMFAIVSGTVAVTRGDHQVAELGPGNIVGELAVLSRLRRNATVTASTDVSVIHIDGRMMQNVLREAPMIAVKMLPVLAARASVNASDTD